MKLISKHGDIQLAQYSSAEDGLNLYAHLGKFALSSAVREALGGAMNDSPDHTWVLALRDGVCVGFGAVIHQKNGVATLAHGYVIEEMRSRKIHARILEARMSIARSWQATMARVTANERSRPNYETAGFTAKTTKGAYTVLEFPLGAA